MRDEDQIDREMYCTIDILLIAKPPGTETEFYSNRNFTIITLICTEKIRGSINYGKRGIPCKRRKKAIENCKNIQAQLQNFSAYDYF